MSDEIGDFYALENDGTNNVREITALEYAIHKFDKTDASSVDSLESLSVEQISSEAVGWYTTDGKLTEREKEKMREQLEKDMTKNGGITSTTKDIIEKIHRQASDIREGNHVWRWVVIWFFFGFIGMIIAKVFFNDPLRKHQKTLEVKDSIRLLEKEITKLEKNKDRDKHDDKALSGLKKYRDILQKKLDSVRDDDDY